MRQLFAKLRAKLGDFWFSTLVVFVACRSSDVLNMFVGLWLVPKYIEPSELGAVMPLSSFAGMLALPVMVFTTVFTKEVNTLATQGEFGRMKSLIRSVFAFAAVFLIVAIVATKFLFPLFLERIRVDEGSLGILIVAASFIGCVAPIYSNVLQALKRFNSFSVLCAVCAPARFLAMLVTMPIRPLSGYFVGQAASPTAGIIGSLFFLRKELSVPAEPYWTRPIVRRFSRFFLGVAACSIAGTIQGLVEQTVLRQRLPDLDSAAYYMVTRFSDIAGLISGTLLFTLFPYTAETAASGRSTRPFVLKSSAVMILLGTAMTVFFAIFGRPILAFLPHGEEYATYAWAIPWLIGLATLGACTGFHTNTEISAGRFGFLIWCIPVHLVCAAILLGITGFGYFTAYLPANWTSFLATHNITSLQAMLWWMTATTLVRCFFCARDLARQA